MDMQKAEKVKQLLDLRADLIAKREMFQNFESISGDFWFDRSNSSPFTINRKSMYITFIIEGLSQRINSITEEIGRL